MEPNRVEDIPAEPGVPSDSMSEPTSHFLVGDAAHMDQTINDEEILGEDADVGGSEDGEGEDEEHDTGDDVEDEDGEEEENDEEEDSDDDDTGEEEDDTIISAYDDEEDYDYCESEDEDEDDSSLVNKKTLIRLPSMPLDLLFEIFGHLPPMDIFSVSRVSKAFRKVLMTPKATSVWKTARERFGAPACPDWMTEPAWAAFLFGVDCETCNVMEEVKIDFRLMKRACTDCRTVNIIEKSRLYDHFAGQNLDITQFVLYSNANAYGHTRQRQFFWLPDVEEMIAQITAFDQAVSLQAPNSVEALEDFKEARKSRNFFLQQNAPAWKEWRHSYNKQRSDEQARQQKRRIQQLTARFLELGYSEGDLSFLSYNLMVKSAGEITDRRWISLRPKLEPEAIKGRQERLEREAAEIHRRRRVMVHNRYTAYKRSVQPSHWKYLPRTFDITLLQQFSVVVEASVDRTVTEESFEAEFEALPNLLASRDLERKAFLRAMLPQTDHAAGEPSATPPQDNDADPLDSVTAAFECKETRRYGIDAHYPYLFGWEDIAAHHCTDPELGLQGPVPLAIRSPVPVNSPMVGYSPSVAKAVVKVLSVAGVGRDTTAKEMDANDVRFGCEKCKVFQEDNVFYKHGYDWRSMIHHLARAYLHNPTMDIFVLSPEEAAEIKECELGIAKFREATRSWICGRCPVDVDGPEERHVVVEHLLRDHAVREPSESIDIVFYQRFRPHLKGAFRFTVPSPGHAA